LYNAYFLRGKRTLRSIFATYAPKGHGNNDPLNYANIVSQKIGVGIDKTLKFEDVIELLARAIIQVETGSDISDADFEKGLYAALDKLGFVLQGGTYTTATVRASKSETKSKSWLWLLVAAAVGYTIYKKRK
jgi:hypothetical protein